MNILNTKSAILQTIREKSILKQLVYKNTVEVFLDLKEVLKNLVKDYNLELIDEPDAVKLEFEDRGASEVQIRIASDILIFSMYSDVFQFDRDHPVWKKDYVKQNPNNAYSGVINIYNFLSDSLKYKRSEDLGYLVARIFINRENHYIVEGKRQMGLLENDLSQSISDKDSLKKIVETAINYSLNFDLLVPPYDDVKILSVADIDEKIHNAKIKTGKRLGFQFKSDDI
ncbi:hypothetical protein [Ancylomarina sp. 16SWW S1-10-2]|uniref:hypothetical protein n=1 Tax=Ancylomarina sp. 16SWW S1-10-2 TaxID=2499681 RepID=UPI0012AE37FB|nr:hypothetical protein [Ancylomarina sp. 16SWW S1-10-2]MRT94034.1 hypothetical protein [Ancylomarina sp. 16SWW S1-10-2]